AEAHAQELGRAEVGDHRPHAVLATVPAARAQLQTPEGQVEIVVDHDDRLGRDLPELGDARDGLTADVHELHWFAQKDTLAPDGRLADLGAELLAQRRRLRARRQLRHHVEADVVAVAGVLSARITEPDHQPHARWLRFLGSGKETQTRATCPSCLLPSWLER